MDKYISKKLSKKFCELFNRPYCFHKHEVLFCEEREIYRFGSVKVIINSNDHQPLHFHIKTTNPEGEYRIYLGEDYSISDIQIKKGKPLPKRIEKTLIYWFNEQNGKEELIKEFKSLGVIG
ncbi:MAG: DUF4160 domain-containing protein [Alphaproteobacteria bacterium]|nr:DUF4160 domain-containing protein [Alphaproteobacteria bacterium]